MHKKITTFALGALLLLSGTQKIHADDTALEVIASTTASLAGYAAVYGTTRSILRNTHDSVDRMFLEVLSYGIIATLPALSHKMANEIAQMNGKRKSTGHNAIWWWTLFGRSFIWYHTDSKNIDYQDNAWWAHFIGSFIGYPSAQ